MDQRQADQALARYMTPLRTISLAFSGSVLLYIGVSYLLIEFFAFAPILSLPLYLSASIAISQMLVILAGYLISLSMRKPNMARATMGVGAGTHIDGAMQRYTKSVVLAAAAREVASVVGLIMTLMTGEMVWVVLLAGAALVSMAVHWPRRAAVEDFLQQQGVGY